MQQDTPSSKQFQSAKGELLLQHCPECGTMQYPPREVCKTCLQHELEWKAVSPQGSLLSWTVLHTSLEPAFQKHLPCCIAEIKLDCGAQLIVQLAIEKPLALMPVIVEIGEGPQGTVLYVASKK